MADDTGSEAGDTPVYQITYKGEEKPYQYVAKDGTATAIYINKDVYTGEFKDKKRHGKGEYVWTTARAKYVGDYVNGQRHGTGTMTYPNGAKYTGRWEHNSRSGQGTYTYANGDRYCGQWANDVKQGQGTYMHVHSGHNTQLTGQWVNGVCKDGVWEFYDNGTFYGILTDGKITQYFRSKADVDAYLKKRDGESEEALKKVLIQLFESYDTDNSGSLTMLEFFRLARLLDPNMSVMKWAAIFKDADPNGDRKVDRDEFLTYASKLAASIQTQDWIDGLTLAKQGVAWVRRGEVKEEESDSSFPDNEEDAFTLHLAARAGSYDAVRRHIAAAARAGPGALSYVLHDKDTRGHTALWIAASCGHYRIAKFLMDQGAKWDPQMFQAASGGIKSLLKSVPAAKVEEKPKPKPAEDQ